MWLKYLRSKLFQASGHNLRRVQKQLCHANITTITVYYDVIGKDLDAAIQALETEEWGV